MSKSAINFHCPEQDCKTPLKTTFEFMASPVLFESKQRRFLREIFFPSEQCVLGNLELHVKGFISFLFLFLP